MTTPLSPKDLTKQTWDTLGSWYLSQIVPLEIYNPSYDLLIETLPPHAEVIELGCGPANISRYLLNHRPDLSITCTDFSGPMLETAKTLVPEARHRVLDATELNSLTHKYDAVIAGFVLPYITRESLSIWMNDVKRILKPDGTLYLSYVEGEPQHSDLKTNSIGQQSLFNYYTAPEIELALAQTHLHLMHHLSIPYAPKQETHRVAICQVQPA